MRTNTTQYEAAHGCKPRGRGLWVFELVTNGNESFTRKAFGKFGEAKAKAVSSFKKEGKAKKVTEVVVLP